MIERDPWGLTSALPWLIAALIGYYLLRTSLALLLLAGSRVRPDLQPAAMRCAPAALRPLLRRVIAGGLLGVALTGGSALAATNDCPAPVAGVPVLDRGIMCDPGQRAGQPPESGPPVPVQAPATTADPSTTYVVGAGDSLWSITADRLGPAATDAAIADAWPKLWQINRAVIGDDPGLIRPGTRLALPAQPTNGASR